MKRLLLAIGLFFTFSQTQAQKNEYENFKIIDHHETLKADSINYLKKLSPKFTRIDKQYTQIENSNNKLEGFEREYFIRVVGGEIQYGLNCLIVFGKDSILVRSHKEFQKVFAPIESREEALEYIYALSDCFPLFDLNFVQEKTVDEKTKEIHKWTVYKPEIETSYVRETDEGYELLLYNHSNYCSNRYYKSIFYLKKDGYYTRKKLGLQFENEWEQICE